MFTEAMVHRDKSYKQGSCNKLMPQSPGLEAAPLTVKLIFYILMGILIVSSLHCNTKAGHGVVIRNYILLLWAQLILLSTTIAGPSSMLSFSPNLLLISTSASLLILKNANFSNRLNPFHQCLPASCSLILCSRSTTFNLTSLSLWKRPKAT